MVKNHVTRSNVNWGQHKEDIKNILVPQIGDKKTQIFMNKYSEKFDPHGRTFLHWKLALSLMDDHEYLKRVGTIWYAVVGTGGTGKSTVLKNIMYFHDDKFDPSSMSFDLAGFIKSIKEFGPTNTMRATFMDEPDDSIHPATPLGKTVRRILGKARQGKYIFGICATDLNDIPPYIFRKINVIIFLQYRGQYMLFKNRPKKKSYLIQEIRRKYADKGYKVFFELAKRQDLRKWVITGSTCKGTPFTDDQEKKYIQDKKDDFVDDLKNATDLIKKAKSAGVIKKKIDPKKEFIFKSTESMDSQGIGRAMQSKLLGMSARRLQEIRKEFKENLASSEL